MTNIHRHQRRVERRTFLKRAAAGAFAVDVAGRIAFGQAAPRDPEKTAVEMMTPAAVQAVQRGLDQLAKNQNQKDGAFGGTGYGRNVAVCSLAGLAFMANGSTPGRGPYGKAIDRCLDYVLANSDDSGFIAAADETSHGPMYGHGFATLFLAECYGMTMRGDIRDKLSKAVALIVSTQNEEGGWRYQPQRHDADLSVTICQVMALRAARNAGIFVPHETIDRCIDYVKRSQNADGGFMYMLQGGQSAFPRSAAGVVALYSAGVYDAPEITKGLEYVLQYLPHVKEASHDAHFFYGQYYAVQAMWHAGGEYWQKWYPTVRDALLARQNEDGSWDDTIGREYGTAMACIVLQMPNNYLPIMQR